jgi:acyl dehydratase
VKGLRLGQRAQATRTFTAADVAAYRRLSGDAGLRFAVASPDAVPGPLLGGMFSQLLGTELPGRGTNWLKQSLTFPAPARLGEAITASVEIVRLRPEKELVNLRTTCHAADRRVVCDGEALVLVRDLEVDAEHEP